MIAHDLMQSRFAFVTADADLDYVAKLLAESGTGVIPVVDDNFAPIGVVTRSNLERARPAPTIDLGPIPAFLLRNRARAPFRANGHALREIMTTPAISVSCGAKLSDIEKMMAEHHLKRVPVVDGHKLVGVLLRREVLNAIAGAGAGAAPEVLNRPKPILTLAQPEPDHCVIATAAEFQSLIAAHENKLEAERAEHRRAIMELRKQRIHELAAQRLTDGLWRDMIIQARAAAASGLSEHLLIRFPSQLCTDGGRAINAPDPHWPETLRGEPADVFRRWRNELHPRGFKIAAQIIDFPEGLPGDAALFLMWGGRS